MKVKWTLVDNRTGELRSGEDDYPYDADGAEFQYLDGGNYRCDCNRELFFVRAGGGVPWNWYPEDDYVRIGCSATNVFEFTKLVHVAADGTETVLV